MTPARLAKLLSWGRTAIMVVALFGMAVALNHLVRSYSFDQIATALGSMPASVILASLGVLVGQHALLVVREWLAIGYAGRADLGLRRTALASVVSRSLSALGVASITGVGLRLRIYGGWGLTTGDVARVTMFNEILFVVGLVARVALVLGVFPIPHVLAEWIPVLALRVIAGVAALAAVVYVVACARGPAEIRIRSLAIPVPTPIQVAGSILLPVADMLLGAAIIYLCMPSGAGLGYADLVVITLLASVAGSLTQIPAGLGVIEGIVLQFSRVPEAASFVIGGLLVRRIITDLVPIVGGGILLVGLELRRRPEEPRPEWLAETTAALLSTLTFVVGVIVMVLSTSPLADRLGSLGQMLALAVGTGILFVSRGLVRRSRLAWQIALGLVMLRAILGVVVAPPLVVIALLVVLGILLALSRSVFLEKRAVLDDSPRWWLAFGLAMAGTAWSAFLVGGRHVTEHALVEGGIMLGVAAVGVASLVMHLARRRREQDPARHES